MSKQSQTEVVTSIGGERMRCCCRGEAVPLIGVRNICFLLSLCYIMTAAAGHSAALHTACTCVCVCVCVFTSG